MQQSSITGFFKKAPRPNAARDEQRSSNDRQGRQERRPGPHRSRGGSSASSTRGQHRGGKSPRNMELKKVARETKDVLPAVLKPLPGFGAHVSSVYDLDGLAALDGGNCPQYVLPKDDEGAGKAGTRIRVLDKDSFDAAIELQPRYKAHVHLSNLPAATSGPGDGELDDSMTTDDEEMDLDNLPVAQPQPPAPSWDLSAKPPQRIEPAKSPEKGKPHIINAFSRQTSAPVAVLNLASERHAGGGWQNGAMAQEEALCYRSSLYRSLHRSYYPLPSLSVIYTPSVLIIRSATTDGHTLYTDSALDLPVTSVISVAALRHPRLTDDGKNFKDPGQRAETKRKIRISLRVAASMGHRKLVLGALGCGVFSNPPMEVAECFLEVFREKEFQGGWWEDVVFAVMDNARGGEGGKHGSGNFGQFYRVLNGQVV